MSALGWDEGRVYHAHVLPGEDQSPDAPGKLGQQFYDFILEFRLDNSYIYRDQLQTNIVGKKYFLDVNVEHLIMANEHLADKLKNEPANMLPLFENAVKKYALKKILLVPGEVTSEHPAWRKIPECQVTLNSNENTTSIRDLNANTISKFVRIPGIVIGASTLSSKATHLCLLCKSCRSTRTISVSHGLTGITLPRTCDRSKLPGEDRDPCPMDPYIIVHEKCTFIDQQTLKLQEAPDMVPVGELPRHILVSADRYLTNRVTPGTRCTILGIYSIFQNKKGTKADGAVAVRNPYVRVVGLSIDAAGNTKTAPTFTAQEEEEFLELSRRPDLYEVFSRSIGPSIYGNNDIKKAIACLLFGGSKKILPDGMKLRGDINVLLLGDPGTAKSQLLKFVEKVAPIAVYTSGKGSSAAGLTASVQRDANTREFYLEGGAMVLADGGVVCIDEFDKMRDEDRVAIHEAMEQQTISIAKAGITTILNSRSSVLAAANPIFGRYDDMKSPGDNIDFQTTILSRFDLIFIVKDTHDAGRDRSIAQHVLNIHINRAVTNMPEGEIPIDKMRSYIRFAKSRCAPRLNDEAAEMLSSHFVDIRRQVHQVEQDSNERSSIPITVRQLEAIIRVSESLAKMTLSTTVNKDHVNEAVRLFSSSTMDAVNNGASGVRKDLNDEVSQIEEEIKKRIPVGFSANYRALMDHFVNNKGKSEHALERAIWVLERKEVLQVRNQRQKVYRIGV